MATILNDTDRQTAERIMTAIEGLDISWFQTDNGLLGRIRTCDLRNPTGSPCCPLEALYAEEKGTTVALGIAVQYYNLNSAVRYALIGAADNVENCDPPLRQRMVGLVGSTEGGRGPC